ncbi:MAG: hypothetical protein NTV87_17125 [Ignavibacteriae bacterium]|nr:hypothetical protein [Ignavibacteriota bacterium]
MTEIKKEISYIIMRAQKRDSRIVRLNELILFSTITGDAWILDSEDKLAICLAKDGVKQVYKLIDTATQFGFNWDYSYEIEGEQFITLNKSGQIRRIFGYPVKEIERKIIKK